MNDFTRREAIMKCNNMLRKTWTLTWADIKPYVQPDEILNLTDALFIAHPNRDMLLDFENEIWRKHDSVSRFIFMLIHPNINIQRKEALHHLASCWTDESQYVTSYSHIDDAVRENARNQYAEITDEEKENMHFFVKTTFIPRNSMMNGSAWCPYNQESNYGDSVRYDWGLKGNQTELNREDWEDFLEKI